METEERLIREITDRISDDFKNKMKNAEDAIKNTILTYTKIKEPITKGKLKWHGIKKVSQPCKNFWWLEQRGKIIGEKHNY